MPSEALIHALKDALEALDAAQVPEDLREVAFARALDNLIGTPARTAGTDTSVAEGSAGGPSGEADGPVANIASRLNIDVSTASRVFDVDEDGVHLVVPRGRFETSKLAATRQVAQLVVAARRAAGLDQEWTSAEHVRRTADDKGVLDSPNFAKALADLDGQGMRIRGERQNREIKINDAGFEAAGKVAEQLVGEE